MKELIRLLETREQQVKADKVVNLLKKQITGKNLFGWRYYIDDVIVKIVQHMIATDFRYTVAIYVRAGMQRAITQLRYANRKKRKGNFETISLDDDIQISDNSFEEAIDTSSRQSELYIKIMQTFGKNLAEQLKPIIYGEEDKLERKVLRKCRNEEFREFLKETSTKYWEV